jgi:hypothetical protein
MLKYITFIKFSTLFLQQSRYFQALTTINVEIFSVNFSARRSED